jgi:hypothetical protein
MVQQKALQPSQIDDDHGSLVCILALACHRILSYKEMGWTI